jgi:hypothetical protein
MHLSSRLRVAACEFVMELVFYESRVWRLIKVSDVVGQRIFWFVCTIPVVWAGELVLTALFLRFAINSVRVG